jgi:hypothetical protein
MCSGRRLGPGQRRRRQLGLRAIGGPGWQRVPNGTRQARASPDGMAEKCGAPARAGHIRSRLHLSPCCRRLGGRHCVEIGQGGGGLVLVEVLLCGAIGFGED